MLRKPVWAVAALALILIAPPLAALPWTPAPVEMGPADSNPMPLRRVWFQHLATWGRSGSAPGQFREITDLALDEAAGELYVAEAGNQRVQVLDLRGQPVRQWGESGGAAGQLIHPAGLALDGQGAVYVADQGSERVQVFTREGEFARLWAHPRLRDIALGPEGRFYVLGEPEAARVTVYDSGGAALRSFPLRDEQDRPIPVVRAALSPAGLLYAADQSRLRLVAFSLSGVYLFQWRFQRSEVTGLGVSPDGWLYASESSGGTHLYNVRGELFGTLPVEGASAIAATSGDPAIVYLAAGDRIHVYSQHLEQERPVYLPRLSRADPPTPTATPSPTATRTASRTPTPTHTPTVPARTATATATTWADTYEPNDSFDHAAGPLASGATYRSYIWTRQDEDYYYLVVHLVHYPITVDLLDGPKTADYDLYLFDGERQLVAKSERVGSIEHITHLPRRAGLYYVLVRSYGGSSRTEPYVLQVVFGGATQTPTATGNTPYPPPATPTRSPTRTPTRTPPQTIPLPTRTATPSAPTPTPWMSYTPTPRR